VQLCCGTAASGAAEELRCAALDGLSSGRPRVVTQVLQDVVVFTEPNEQINGVAGVARCDAHFLHEVPRAAVSSVIDASFSGPPQRSAAQRSSAVSVRWHSHSGSFGGVKRAQTNSAIDSVPELTPFVPVSTPKCCVPQRSLCHAGRVARLAPFSLAPLWAALGPQCMHATARLCCASVAISRAWRSAHALWDAFLSGALGGIVFSVCRIGKWMHRWYAVPPRRATPMLCSGTVRSTNSGLLADTSTISRYVSVMWRYGADFSGGLSLRRTVAPTLIRSTACCTTTPVAQ
jgi:hypothetical protein